jgi:hypothetical protein
VAALRSGGAAMIVAAATILWGLRTPPPRPARDVASESAAAQGGRP